MSKYTHWILLGILVIIAFLLRVVLQWDTIFQGNAVLFREVDPWYHMRIVDSMVANHLSPLTWDPYAVFPPGAKVGYFPIQGWIISGLALLLGWGAPSVSLVETIAVFVPPVAGALTIIVVYLLGLLVFNSKVVGGIAALLIAILPTEFFHRTLLGFNDHHALEVLFLFLTLYLLERACRSVSIKPAIFAGISLSIYLLNWYGSLFLCGLLLIWFLIRFLWTTLRGEDSYKYTKIMLITSLTGAIIYAPFITTFSPNPGASIVFLLAMVALPLLGHLILRLTGDGKTTVIYLLSLLLLGGVSIFFISPNIPYSTYLLVQSMFWGFGSTISEAEPTDIVTAFQIYGISFLALWGGLFFAIKDRRSLLLIVTTVLLVLAAIGQRRWGYYAVVPLGLMTGYLVTTVTSKFNLSAKVPLTLLLCVFLVITNIRGTVSIASMPTNITQNWYNSLEWMKNNTPEPFSKYPNSYLRQDITTPADYGVLSWWDYGHWIIRVAQRVPLASPTHQQTDTISKFLLSQTDLEAREALKPLNIPYVILTVEMITTKFKAIVVHGGLDPDNSDTIRFNSQIYRMWNGTSPDWKLIHEEGEVRIYEKNYSNKPSK